MNSTHQSIKISYAICVHNETDSLKNLIDTLVSNKDTSDEIVIIDDFSDNEFTKKQIKRVDKIIYKKLLDDFASHKNLFFQFCGGDYIFNIDADELPSVPLLKNIKKIVKEHSNVDLFYIPRENYIDNITKVKLNEFGWQIDAKNRINYPDTQGRIFKNKDSLKWVGDVHETIHNSTHTVGLPTDSQYYLTHRKDANKLGTFFIPKNEFRTRSKTRLPKKRLGIVCCYFNPCNYLSKFLNYIKFIDYFAKFDVDVLTVESYEDTSQYRINQYSDNIISIKSDSVFWQKENLLNIGIDHLHKNEYEYIMWIDADIEFVDDNWPDLMIKSVEAYGISQIFRYATRKIDHKKYTTSKSACYYTENTDPTNDTKTLLKREGEPGYGYCYHRSFFDKHRLFDKAIMGTGDFLNLIGLFHTEQFNKLMSTDRFFTGITTDFLNCFCDWSASVSSWGEYVGYANVDINVSYHGRVQDRQYINRESILKKFKFMPSNDLQETNSGLYKLTNQVIETEIKKYFISRDEDRFFNKDDFIRPTQSRSNKSGNIKFIKSQTNHLIQYHKDQCKKICDFKIEDCGNMLVVSKKNNNPISLSEVNTKNKIIIDSSSQPSVHSYINKTDSTTTGDFYNYFSFISEFYDELPEYCIFVNDSIQIENHISNINNLLSSTKYPNKITHICGKKPRPIGIHPHKHIKNLTTASMWWKSELNDYYSPSLEYTPGRNFMVTRDTIRIRNKNFYQSFLRKLESNTAPADEYFLERAIQRILK
jgi:hypothetical protein